MTSKVVTLEKINTPNMYHKRKNKTKSGCTNKIQDINFNIISIDETKVTINYV